MNRRQFLATGLLAFYPGYTIASEPVADADVTYLSPQDVEYDRYRHLFNKRLSRRPRLIAVCKTETGVQKAIGVARKMGLPVSVKSGGHSFEGYSVNDGSLTIDLTLMNRFKLTGDLRFVAGPACRLMQMYETLIPQGRLIPTGSCGMVGMAGITLGGGYGLFSREHGLACDHLQRVRLIDGNGRIQVAEPGSELMWACRGGGNGNFGIVTQLEFDTVKAPRKIWSYRFRAGQLTAKRSADIVRKWFLIARLLPKQCFSAFVVSGKRLTIVVTSTMRVADPQLSGILDQLAAITDRRTKDRHDEIMPGVRRYYGRLQPLYFNNASAGYYRTFSDIAPVAEKIFSVVHRTPGMIFQINTLGGAIADSVHAPAASYAHRDYGFLGEVQTYWQRPQQEAMALKAVADVQAQLRHIEAHYCNYVYSGFNNWPSAYYGDSYRRLQAIKRRFDQDNLIRHPQSIRPA